MAETESGSGARPAGRRSGFLVIVLALAVLFGIIALAMAAIGWVIELGPAPADFGQAFLHYVDIVVRTVKVLLLSDIYYDDKFKTASAPLLESARAFGVLASILFGVRLLLYAVGSQLYGMWFRMRSSNHDVVIGDGSAAVEYAAHLGGMFKHRRAIHLATERAPTGKRLATVARRGSLDAQLRHARANRARRIIVDEGDDAETWQSAQLIARACKKAEVLAHITDPWMRDRLSREVPTYRLSAFSYAGGAARQVMLAHPPYLLADRLGAKERVHIMIVGFGQVGQSLAREFIVTSIVPDRNLMVTVIDPSAASLETDFRSRHPDLCRRKPNEIDSAAPAPGAPAQDAAACVDFDFIQGDFRLNSPDLFKAIRARNDQAPISAVYVAIDDDHRPLSLSLAIRASAAQEALFASPIFICAQHGAGLSNVRHGAGLVGPRIAARDMADIERQAEQEGRLCNLRVVSFGSWPQAFDGAGLLEAEYDGQARLYHEQYRKLVIDQAKKDKPAEPPPSIDQWPALRDQLRVSNRRVAAHVRAKASAAGFDLAQWLDSESGDRRVQELPREAAELFTDAPDFMEKMARLEHRRWMLDRFLDGWRWGSERDDHARRRSDLIPFDQLTPESKHKDDGVIKTTRILLAGGVGSKGRKR